MCSTLTLVYDGSLLARGLLTELYGVCKDWSSDLPLLRAPVDKVDLSVFAIKNSRRKMEDRQAICVDVNSLYRFTVKQFLLRACCVCAVMFVNVIVHTTIYVCSTCLAIFFVLYSPRIYPTRPTMLFLMVILAWRLLSTPLSICLQTLSGIKLLKMIYLRLSRMPSRLLMKTFVGRSVRCLC